jgi:arsenate reductase
MPGKPTVLILCTGNSCRSQMAEGLLRHFAGDKYEVQSAGTEPKPEVHPLAVQVMSEVGIDIGEQRPKPLTQFLGRSPVRYLILVCDKAQGNCPTTWPGIRSRTYLPFDDPAEFKGLPEEKLEVFRRVRDEIRAAMEEWEPESV